MPNKQKHDPVVICRSCGAEYSAELPDCPYCGTMNLPAAESAYMNKLEDMRSDLESLGGLTGRQTRKDFRAFRKKLLLAALLLGLAVAALYGVHLCRERAETRREREEYLWQRDAFAEMDACYAAGDYEALLALYYDAMDGEHDVWQYKHYDFCEFLMDIENTRYLLQEYEDGLCDPDWLLHDGLRLYRLEYMPKLSEEDRAVLDKMRAPLLEELDAAFHLTEDELSAFRKILARDGMVSYAECQRFLEERGAGT